MPHALSPNPPFKRFQYVAKTYGEKHPDVVLDTFMILADTVGIDDPTHDFRFADTWNHAAFGNFAGRSKRRAELWDQGFTEADAILPRKYPEKILRDAIGTLRDVPAMQRGRESDALWPWVARELVRLKKRVSPLKYLSTIDEVEGRGPALALWQRTERIDLGKYTLDEALEALEDFVVEGEVEQGEVVFEWPDGWTMQQLGAEQLEDEGEIMQHCVGDYCDVVETGASVIYSLRDPSGQPHVTVEYVPAVQRFSQIFGKQNRDPKPEYQDRIDNFAERIDLRPSDALTKGEHAMAYAYGEERAASDWGRWTEEIGESYLRIAEGSPDVPEDALEEMVNFYPRLTHMGYAMPANALEGDLTLDDLERAELEELFETAISEGFNAKWQSQADDALSDLDYAVEDVVKQIRDGSDEDPEKLVRESINIRLDVVFDADVEDVLSRVEQEVAYDE